MPTSTRFAANASPTSSSLKSVRPALSSEIGRPAIEPELSRSRRQGQRGSGLSANSAAARLNSVEYGTWSNDDIVSPRRKRNDYFWLVFDATAGTSSPCSRNVCHRRNRFRRHRHTRSRANTRIGGSSFHCFVEVGTHPRIVKVSGEH